MSKVLDAGAAYQAVAGMLNLAKSRKQSRGLRAGMAIIAGQMERTCVHCGCDESHACDGGCSWAVKHKHTNTGVCSRCVNRNVDEALKSLKPL